MQRDNAARTQTRLQSMNGKENEKIENAKDWRKKKRNRIKKTKQKKAIDVFLFFFILFYQRIN